MQSKSPGDIRSWLTATVARHAKLASAAVDTSVPFHVLGIDSVTRMTIVQEMSDWLGVKVPDLALEEHPTIDRVVSYLDSVSEQEVGG